MAPGRNDPPLLEKANELRGCQGCGCLLLHRHIFLIYLWILVEHQAKRVERGIGVLFFLSVTKFFRKLNSYLSLQVTMIKCVHEN